MITILKVALTITAFVLPWLAGMQSADAQSAPRPLYTSFKPATKEDPCSFEQNFFVGNCIPFDDIDLENVPAATSVEDANNRFSLRAAAAILYAADTSISEGGFKHEQDYGVKILAKMAYTDYFSGPDQVPGSTLPSGTLRGDVNASVLKQTAGIVGSTIDRDEPISFHRAGEYDVLLTAFIKLYYKYYDVLGRNVCDHIFNTLLSERGPYDPGEKFSVDIASIAQIPETENHRLMIQAAKYLINQLYFQNSIANGHPDHANFDNNRNGNPPMVEVILGMLGGYLTSDFVEYNARNYQDYTLTALMNLASYAYDDRVRLMARMVLDYIWAKVAVSSEDLRRATPFRRRNEDQHLGPTIQGSGFLGSPLVFNFCCVPGSSPPLEYEPDPQGAFYTMLAGNIGILHRSANPATGRVGHAPKNYAFEMVHAGLSDYRVPPSILDLFVCAAGKGRSRRFYQGFHHYAGSNPNFGFPGESRFWYVNELYAGSASYLISAGANPSYYAYTANIAGLSHPGDNADFGVALPTTLMPSLDSPQGESGISLGNIIQFGRAPGDFDSENHLCVAPDFACGGPIYVPNAFEPAKNPKDPNLVSDGNWTFVNRGSDGTKPGYYLAIYRVSNPGSTGLSGDWGFLEAYDTWFHPGLSFSPPLDFGDFQQAVKRANPSIQLQVSNDQKCGLVFLCGINDYVTVSGQHIHFKLGTPRSTIISTTAEPDRTAYTNTFAHGSIIKSDQRPTLVPTGSGLITISNPALGEQLILDARDINRPSRTSESGHVESAGANQEVWVDSKYPGTGPTAGDFGDPFRTLTDAKKGVAVGGTINIINAGRQNAPTVFSKRMTIRAVPGPATFIQ